MIQLVFRQRIAVLNIHLSTFPIHHPLNFHQPSHAAVTDMFILNFVAFTVVSDLSLLARATTPGALAVKTGNVPIQGHLADNCSEVTEFLGIPYAQTPVGNLRFAAPEPYRGHGLHVADSFVGIDIG